MIVAFGHKSGVGKDTAAKMLVSLLRLEGRHKDVRKSAFARPLKDAAHLIWGAVGLKNWQHYEYNPTEKDVVLPLCGKTPRKLWIELGMKCREVWEDTWAYACVASASECDVLVVADLRFLNEVKAVAAFGGLLVKVQSNRGTMHAADHELTGFDGWDCVIENDGTLRDLEDNVRTFAKTAGLL